MKTLFKKKGDGIKEQVRKIDMSIFAKRIADLEMPYKHQVGEKIKFYANSKEGIIAQRSHEYSDGKEYFSDINRRNYYLIYCSNEKKSYNVIEWDLSA